MKEAWDQEIDKIRDHKITSLEHCQLHWALVLSITSLISKEMKLGSKNKWEILDDLSIEPFLTHTVLISKDKIPIDHKMA